MQWRITHQTLSVKSPIIAILFTSAGTSDYSDRPGSNQIFKQKNRRSLRPAGSRGRASYARASVDSRARCDSAAGGDPGDRNQFRVATEHPPADALHIQVIAHQWWWEFRYPNYEVTTANEVHIPVNRTVYFSLNSADVIHSFWLLRLGGKRDVIPNHTNELIFAATRTGEYYGECAEFCGLSHANMRMRVFVDSAGNLGNG